MIFPIRRLKIYIQFKHEIPAHTVYPTPSGNWICVCILQPAQMVLVCHICKIVPKEVHTEQLFFTIKYAGT